MTDPTSPTTPLGHWRSRRGVDIPIKELVSEHLVNIIRMLQRKAEYNRALKVAEQFKYVPPTSAGASDAFDTEFDRILYSTWRDFAPKVYQELEDEARLRELEIPEPVSLLTVETKIIQELVQRRKTKGAAA
jgi:hypothetical protein